MIKFFICHKWYRRSYLCFKKIKKVEKLFFDEKDISNAINRELLKEYNEIISFFIFSLNKKAILNKEEDNKLNKLEVLRLASDCGLKIPDTVVSNVKKDLEIIQNKDVITKSIGNFIALENNRVYSFMTNKIKINKIPKNFFFSKFQENIKKKYELRIFYFNNKFFATAIFSQESEKTKLDFRNYDEALSWVKSKM